jgi:IclR family pca regulon transcriptional regulator
VEAVAEERGGFVIALARGLSVMTAFTEQNEKLTLSEVARLVELPRATVRRCLLTLQSLGYVEAQGRHFSLSPQVLTIAQAYLSSSVLPRVAQPFVERVSQELDESCSVSILHRQDVIYVSRSSRRRVSSLQRGVGTHLPAFCTSMGRVLLAGMPEKELETFLKTAVLTPYTPNTIATAEALRPVLARVQREGYCIVKQEFDLSLRSVAVPLYSAAGRLVAALNVSTQAAVTRRRELVARHLPVLQRAAADMRPLLVG